MTIEQYLIGKVDFNVKPETLASLLFDRGIAEGANVTSLSQKQRDLVLADLYMFLATSSTSSSAEVESDSGYTKQTSARNVYDRGAYASMADALYEKWGEVHYTSIAKMTLKRLY